MQRRTSAFGRRPYLPDAPDPDVRDFRLAPRIVCAAVVVVIVALVVGLLSSSVPWRRAEASTGDNLREFTAGVPPCSVGTGVAFDGSRLILSCWGSNQIWRVNPADGSLVDALTIAGVTDLRGLAWDASRGKLWACNGTQQVVLIDTAARIATPVFTSLGCIDGLAYDGADDTIWAGYQFASSIQHYRTSGTLIATLSLFGKIGGCGQTGIAVGGDTLFIANDGCSQLFQCTKDLANCSLLSATPRPLDDLECDDVTFAPASAVWSIDRSDRVMTALEVPAGTCALGGAPPTPTPTNTPTDTPTPTNTPTDTPTPTPTDTPVPTSTATSTNTATPTTTETPISVPTAVDPAVTATMIAPTASPTPQHRCVDASARFDLLIGIVRHFGERVDSHNSQFDLNGDGRIDARDLMVLMRATRCSARHR
jgi:hypothetical protein